MLHGRPAKDALEEHGKDGASKLLKQASDALQRGRGLGIRPKSIKEVPHDIFTSKLKRKK